MATALLCLASTVRLPNSTTTIGGLLILRLLIHHSYHYCQQKFSSHLLDSRNYSDQISSMGRHGHFDLHHVEPYQICFDTRVSTFDEFKEVSS